MARKLFRWLLVPLYGAVVYFCLRHASPVFIDGGGPTPSFFWGSPPAPEMGEYYRRQSYYDLVYAIPYAEAAVVITIAACVAAPKIVRHPHAFWSVSAVTLILLLILATASDIGSHLRWWNGPLFLLYGEFGLYDRVMLARLALPISFLAGVVAAAKLALKDNSRDPD